MQDGCHAADLPPLLAGVAAYVSMPILRDSLSVDRIGCVSPDLGSPAAATVDVKAHSQMVKKKQLLVFQRFVQGETQKEIAESMKISASLISKALAAARDHLVSSVDKLRAAQAL